MSSGQSLLFPRDRRLASIDLFRGVVMFLLIGGAAGFFDLLVIDSSSFGIISSLGRQFRHTPWIGLRLVDLGQPFFMFISGVAMVFSYQKRWNQGETWISTFLHCLQRAGLLFLLGWALFHISSDEGATQTTLYVNVLPQLALASLVAFLLLRRTATLQIAVSASILIATELLYRLWPVPGFDQPFVPGKNVGSFLDLKLFGKLSEQNVVAFNIVPAVVYVLLGIVAGGLLGGQTQIKIKLRRLIGTGTVGVVLGLALSSITPIIRRLETSSFVILAGGLAFLALALGYWLAEIRGLTKRSLVFVSIGRNPLFIFLFSFTGGAIWLQSIAMPFTMSFECWIGTWGSHVLTSLAVWAMLCAICYALYHRGIFMKI